MHKGKSGAALTDSHFMDNFTTLSHVFWHAKATLVVNGPCILAWHGKPLFKFWNFSFFTIRTQLVITSPPFIKMAHFAFYKRS